MKIHISIISFLFFHFLNAQELKTYQLLSPDAKGINDLYFLKEELKDKRLVTLGELTHQYGTFFEIKTRIIKYLHQELGYTTIAMETSMYDLWVLNKTTSFDPDLFNKTVYGIWSNTKEFQGLVNYISRHNLKVIGFDSQVSNADKFIDDFFDYCEDNNIEIEVDQEDMAIVMQGVLDAYSFDEYDMNFSTYEKELERIIKKIASLKNTDDNYYWKQFSKNIMATSRDAYKNPEEIKSYHFINAQHNIRDAQMADNILSYMQRNPLEKIVLWADNIHIINAVKTTEEPVLKEFISMGSYLKKALKNKVYSLATLHANDSISYQNKWSKTPILNGSFEDELRTLNSPYLFISSDQEGMKRPRKHRLLSYLDFFEGRLDELHDGYVFAKHAKDSKPNTIDTTAIKKFDAVAIDSTKAKMIKKKNIRFLTGTITDATSNEPVPYATLILKKEEVYRVADLNGNFKIPITTAMLNTASVHISSMGFASQNIPLKELTKTVRLSPSIESLNEVIITGHRTPYSVLKTAIKNIKINHPITPFNYQRYTNAIINQNDENILNIDLITKEYDQGYRQLNRVTQRVDQIKWNRNKLGKSIQNTRDLFRHRQNALRYSNILHRRKYKKFDLTFAKSNKSEDDDFYIIEFKTERNKWNYTNRGYPTTYSGKVYINREDFAIIKVIENWETTLHKNEIEDTNYTQYKLIYKGNLKEVKIKEEKVCDYLKHANQKYYANQFLNRSYTEYILDTNEQLYLTFEFNSSLFDINTQNIEIIDYDFYKQNETVLRRVAYNKDFWNSFQNKLFLNTDN